MGATYTAIDYLGLPMAILCCGLILFPLAAICLIFKLVRKHKNVAAGFLPVLAMVPLLVLLVLWGGPVFAQVGDLMLPGECVIRTTAGEIESLEPGARGSRHFLDGRIVTGQMVSLGGQRYYVISENLLKEGMLISLTYSHSGNGNVILSWEETTAEEAKRIRAESAASNPELPAKVTQEITPEQYKLGTWLMRIGLSGFLVSMGLTMFFREKIIFWLLAKDAKVRGEIRVSPRKLLLALHPMGCILLLCIGIDVTSAGSPVWFIVLLALCALAVFVCTECTTSLKLEGHTLTLRRLWREKQYHLSDVRGVSWQKHRGFIGQSLVLVMEDGTGCWFNLDTYVGVQDVHTRLSRYLEEAKKCDT